MVPTFTALLGERAQWGALAHSIVVATKGSNRPAIPNMVFRSIGVRFARLKPALRCALPPSSALL
jgi:hypothetical protein